MAIGGTSGEIGTPKPGYDSGPQTPTPDFPGTNIPQQYSGRGFTGPQSLLNIPGVSIMSQAGIGQEAVDTGLPKEVEAAYILAQQVMSGAQPSLDQLGTHIQDIRNVTEAGIPGMLDFMRQQAGIGQNLQQSQLGALSAGQAGTQQALQILAALQGAPGIGLSQEAAQRLSGALGQSGLNLTPEQQALIARERQLGIDRSRQAAEVGKEQRLSELQALMAGRGLGATSIAGRGAGEILTGIEQQAEAGRLAAEQQALQRELGLRELGLTERGQTLSGLQGLITGALQPVQLQAGMAGQAGQLGLGLGQQGLSGMELALQQLGQYGAPQQLQQEIAMMGIPLSLEQAFRQEQISGGLRGLEAALGAPVQPSGPGLGEILGGLAGAVLGGGAQVGAAYAGKK